MKFCNECGALLYPKKSMKNGNLVFQCKICGNKVIPESVNKEDLILHVELDEEKKKIWFIKEK